MPLTIDDFGRLIVAKRGKRGVRAAAEEVGISPATLSRIENGHHPDIATFAKICDWLERDPREFFGFNAKVAEEPKAVAHFRKKRTVSKDTAMALGELILAVQRAVQARSDLLDQS